MLRYVISPYIVTADPTSGVIFNKHTGERHETSETTRDVLSLFKKPATFNEALQAMQIEDGETEAVIDFLSELVTEGVLILENTKLSEKVTISLTARLERPTYTMLGCPAREIENLSDADIVFVGSPFDLGSTGYPGSRYAPDKMRELSSGAFEYHADIFTGKSVGWYSHGAGRNVLEGVSFADVGNVLHHVGETFESYFERVRSVVQLIVENGSFPVILGGDHSVSYPNITAYKMLGREVGVIHVDAHTDLGSLVDGISNNHGNVFTRLIKEDAIKGLYQFGVRSFAGTTPKGKYSLTPTRSIQQKGVRKVVKEIDPRPEYFLSLDIDVLDPAFASGTGTPVPNGLTQAELFDLLTILAKHVKFVGCDLVEVNPMLDRNDTTSLVAIETLLHFLGEVFK